MQLAGDPIPTTAVDARARNRNTFVAFERWTIYVYITFKVCQKQPLGKSAIADLNGSYYKFNPLVHYITTKP